MAQRFRSIRTALSWRSFRRGFWAFLATALACLAPNSVSAQKWPDEHVSGPFAYHADFQLQPIFPLLRTVSELQHDVPSELGLDKVSERVHVFLFEKQSTYHKYIKKYFPDAPLRPALFIKQRGPGMVFARLGPQLDVDLRHETTHAVLHSMLPMVPLWLDEGLGEYFELPPSERASRHAHFKAIRKLSLRNRVPSLESLEALGDLSEMNADHYRDCWSWVHFMLHGPPEAKRTLTLFLRDIEGHVPPGSLSRRLRLAIPDLEQQYLMHFRRWR